MLFDISKGPSSFHLFIMSNVCLKEIESPLIFLLFIQYNIKMSNGTQHGIWDFLIFMTCSVFTTRVPRASTIFKYV